MAYSGASDRGSAARRFAGRRRRRGIWGALVVALAASVGACSLVLQQEAIPCASDGDCAKYSGSMCDLTSKQCVAGTPPDADLDDATSATNVDGAPGAESSTDASGLDSSIPDVTAPQDVLVPDDAADGGGLGTPDGSSDDAADGSDAATIDWPALTQYLDSLYNSGQQLVERSPASGTYYTEPDNGLAQRAFLYLPVPDTAKSAAILNRLKSYKICGCSAGPHDATTNHQFDPLVTKGATIPLDPGGDVVGMPTDTRSPGGTCSGADAAIGPVCPPTGIWHDDRPSLTDAGQEWGVDMCNATAMGGYSLSQWSTSGVGQGYADLIALEILSYRTQGLYTPDLWTTLLGKWDNVGMNDGANTGDGFYSIYKLALFKIVARALNQPLPAGVDATLIASQGTNGGIRTNYTASGFVDDQAGSAETTALVVLAFLMPVADL